MPITCPACRKVNDGETQCQRCKADLTALGQIQRCADLALQNSAFYLKQSDGPNALAQAELAWHLRHSRRAARMAFMACLLLGQFTTATDWYQAMQRWG